MYSTTGMVQEAQTAQTAQAAQTTQTARTAQADWDCPVQCDAVYYSVM